MTDKKFREYLAELIKHKYDSSVSDYARQNDIHKNTVLGWVNKGNIPHPKHLSKIINSFSDDVAEEVLDVLLQEVYDSSLQASSRGVASRITVSKYIEFANSQEEVVPEEKMEYWNSKSRYRSIPESFFRGKKPLGHIVSELIQEGLHPEDLFLRLKEEWQANTTQLSQILQIPQSTIDKYLKYKDKNITHLRVAPKVSETISNSAILNLNDQVKIRLKNFLSGSSVEVIHPAKGAIVADLYDLRDEYAMRISVEKNLNKVAKLGSAFFIKAFKYSGVSFSQMSENTGIPISTIEKYVSGTSFFGDINTRDPKRSLVIAKVLAPHDDNLAENMAVMFLGGDKYRNKQELKNDFLSSKIDFSQLVRYSRISEYKTPSEYAADLGFTRTTGVNRVERGNNEFFRNQDHYRSLAVNKLDISTKDEYSLFVKRVNELRAEAGLIKASPVVEQKTVDGVNYRQSGWELK